MPLADQADHISRPIDDDSKQVGDVAAKHAHVESGDFRERRELTSKGDSAAILTEKDDLGLDTDGGAHTAYPGKLIGKCEMGQVNCFQNVRAEDSTIRPDVHQKTRLYPSAVPSQDLAAKNRSRHVVIAQVPHATDEHRCVPAFPWE